MARDRIANMNEEEVINYSPERTLWLAVIERALKDYCFFFDYLDRLPQPSVKKTFHLDQMDRKNVMYRRTIGDFSRLRWFLFDRHPRPFNLSYLMRELYNEDESMAEAMRKQAREQFKLQLDKIREQGRFNVIVKYIEENTNADKTTPAVQESSLRTKRYRLTTDV